MSELKKIIHGFRDVYVGETGEISTAHCIDFAVKRLSKGNFDSIDTIKSSLEGLGDKNIKIVTVLTPIPNIYYLSLLGAISELLKLEPFTGHYAQLKFEILLTEISKKMKYLIKPFIEHNKLIQDFENNLQMGLNIFYSFDKSLINIMVRRILKLEWNSKLFNNIDINFWKIEKYIEEIDAPELKNEVNEELENIKQQTSGIKITNRSIQVLFQTKMIHNVLRIWEKYINNDGNSSESTSKVIFIIGEPVANIIKYLMERTLIPSDNKNVMIVFFSDPVHLEDPRIILENIPSYITILSFYYNRKLISYGIDEYYHAKVLKSIKNEEIISPIVRDIANTTKNLYNREIITDTLDTLRNFNDINDLIDKLENGTTQEKERGKKILKIAKAQEEILKIEENMFLQVQSATLEQLKLLL